VSANRNGNPRSIEDFPCIASESYSSILDQIILDEKFSEIQEKSEAFIESLEQDKKAIVTNPNEVIDDIMNNF